MYVHNIDPTLFSFSFLQIRFYGIVYAFGFLLTYFLLLKNKNKLKIKKNQIETLILGIYFGLIIGARIFHFLFSDPLIFINDPIEVLKIWHGGMSFFGALLGIFIFTYYYLKKIKLKWTKFADIIVLAVSFTLIFGRIANFINGELIGTPSNLPWCVIFTQIDTVCRHPYQIYASISHLFLFGIIFFVYKLTNKKKLKNGTSFFTFLLFYSVFRFITDFFREDLRFFGITHWQYVCVIVIGISLYAIIKGNLYKFTKKK
jgi:phosphatidylglycerol---prolipoprotein diacylglyceryl transferase